MIKSVSFHCVHESQPLSPEIQLPIYCSYMYSSYVATVQKWFKIHVVTIQVVIICVWYITVLFGFANSVTISLL